MLRWFEKTDEKRPGVISSRIRLVRNWEEYKFPAMLGTQESEEMVRRLEFGLKDLAEVEGRKYEYAMLEELEELEESVCLRDVAHMPARVKCAVLGWHTLEELLKNEGQ